MGEVGTIRRKDSERNRSRILRDWTPEIDANSSSPQGWKLYVLPDAILNRGSRLNRIESRYSPILTAT